MLNPSQVTARGPTQKEIWQLCKPFLPHRNPITFKSSKPMIQNSILGTNSYLSPGMSTLVVE